MLSPHIHPNWRFLMRIVKTLLAAALIVTSLLTTGCSPSSQEAPSNTKLRVGLLHTGDTLPVVVAQEFGFFTDEGIEVEIINFQSAVERDSAFQAKAIDGMAADLIGTTLMRSKGQDVRIVSLTVGEKAGVGRVALLVSPNSGITSVEQLVGKEIALSKNTVIEYITDELLAANGIDPESTNKVSVANISMRINLLINDEVAAATLVDPLASFAEAKGARAILDDKQDNLGQAVLTFHGSVVDSAPKAMSAFMCAYNHAVDTINADRPAFSATLQKISRLPKEIESSYDVIEFPNRVVPTAKQVDRVVSWLKRKNLVEESFTSEGLVTDAFIPDAAS
jgi:NitT/TauT family transport system substrate-binding protein